MGPTPISAEAACWGRQQQAGDAQAVGGGRPVPAPRAPARAWRETKAPAPASRAPRRAAPPRAALTTSVNRNVCPGTAGSGM